MGSAESHRFSEISSSQPPSELHFQPSTSNFTPILQYNDSKLFCHLFSRSCHQRLYSEGICSLSVHPGNLLVANFHRNSTSTICCQDCVVHSPSTPVRPLPVLSWPLVLRRTCCQDLIIVISTIVFPL